MAIRHFPGTQLAASKAALRAIEAHSHRRRLEVMVSAGQTIDVVGEWQKHAAIFPAAQPLARAVEEVPGSILPEPYKTLLLHSDLMTLAMERFHRAPIDVRVLARRIDGMSYSREIMLVRQDTGAVVQFAFAHFNLDAVSEVVRQDILGEQVPLGRVLVNHRIDYQTEVIGFLKVTVGARLAELLNSPVNVATYGRVGRLLCGGKPTFNVIEVSAPVERRASSGHRSG